MSDPIFHFDDEPDHPVARAWLARIRRGEQAILTLWRKRDGLTFKPAKIYMTFQTPRGEERDHDDWDVDLNAALVREGIRAETPTNEAGRLTLMMRYWFLWPERDYGPGFFEAILVEIARGFELASQTPLREVLSRISVTPSAQTDSAYRSCKDAIEGILRDQATRPLVRDLRYPADQAQQIVAEALARYLDERFHVTTSRMLGV